MLSLWYQAARIVRPITGGQFRGYTVASVSLFEDLTHRGFIHHVTRPTVLREVLESKPQVVYAGVDPTAQSLHIGHLIPLMCLLHFHIHGHKIIPLIGGATGRVGDPSGRYLERQLTGVEQVEDNAIYLTKSIEDFFKHASIYAEARIGKSESLRIQPFVMNNLRWHENISMLDFLQNVGIHARVNAMLNRESVRARLTSQQGLSFTELTYQLLQAYDFYHLHKHFDCTIQVGGSDQWGNILAGLELISRCSSSPDPSSVNNSSSSKLLGITTPLLTTSSGQKFGKSAGNAVWLDSNRTSIFDFYQYFIKVDDIDVEKYLNLFTLLSRSEICTIMMAHTKRPEKRIAQRRLAAEVTEMVHTTDGLVRAQVLTRLLFESDYTGLKTDQIISAFGSDPRLVFVDKEELLNFPIMKLAVKYRLVSSGSASRLLVQSRGLRVNNKTVPELQSKITGAELIENRVAILHAGRDKLLILIIKND